MKNIFIILFFIFSVCGNAQTKGGESYRDLVQEGNFLFLEENYNMALQNYLQAYAMDSTSGLLNYNIGVCYLNTLNTKFKAEQYLEYSVKKVSNKCIIDDPMEKSSPPLAHYYYGKALHLNYKFDEALKEYENFEKYVSPKDKEWKKTISRDKDVCAFAKMQMEVPLNVQIVSLGDSVNSQYPDYSPALSADERMLIFTTRRPNTTGGMKDDNGNYYEDVVVSYKDDEDNWSSPVSLSESINGNGMDAAINITPDGQTLILYRDGGDGMGGNIYYSTFDGTDWSPLKDFGSDVNSKYQESHACLNADGTVLIFVSNRPGGYGGRDLYRCVKLPTGNWSKALNMGPVINTEYDEDGAFIHPDGRTFFFASNGHKSMGGFDIMFATLDENNQFSDVTNMGYPINTTDDDVFYVTSPDGKRGYFSSAKEGGLGEKDLYMVSMPTAKEKPLALFKGKIVAAPGEKLPEDLVIIVKDKETGEIIGTYRPKQNGTFTTILPPGREYTFSYQAPKGNEFYSEDVFVSNDISYKEIKREVSLEPVTLLGTVKAKSNTLLLNIVVLDNVKSKKPIENAKLTVTGSDGKAHEYSTNASGRHDNLPLTLDVDYKIMAESGDSKSEMISLTTKGIKPPKVFSQTFYLEKPVVPAKGEYSLEVLVRNKKLKPIKDANVILIDANGNKFEGATDALGVLKNIPIDSDLKYELSASIDDKASEKIAFNTNKIKPKTVIKKTLTIDQSKTGAVTVADNVLPEGEYQFFFRYGRTKVDETEESWTNFVKKIADLSKQKAITVDVYSSASTVPTRARGHNKGLAAARGKKTAERLSESITAAGGDVSKIIFKRRSKVNGPVYNGDPRNHKRYDPHQYVKIKVF